VLAGKTVRTTTHGRRDDEPFLIEASPVVHGGRREALVVGTSLEGVDAAVNRVVRLTWPAPALLLVTALGGWCLARKALRPVARVTERAERIEVDRLDERVPVPHTADEIAPGRTLNHMLDHPRPGRRYAQAHRGRRVARAAHAARGDAPKSSHGGVALGAGFTTD
jgi:hypothetical protein